MDPKSGLGGIVIGATIATVAALALKGEDMTATDIKAAADSIRANEAQVTALLQDSATWSTPEVARCFEGHKGTLAQCYPEVAEMGSPKDAGYRVSYYACKWVDGDNVETYHATGAEEECARKAVKMTVEGETVVDTREKPALVRVETPKPAPVDPHPRDMSVPVYGKAGGAVAEQPKEIEEP